VGNAVLAAAGTAVLSGAMRAAPMTARKFLDWSRGNRPDRPLTQAERNADALLQREAEVGDSTPNAPTVEGDTAHLDTFQRAMDEVAEGRPLAEVTPAPRGEAPFAPPLGISRVRAGDLLTGGEARGAIPDDFDPARAGVLLVYEREDGGLMVMDGRKRVEAAQRANPGQELDAVVVRERDGYTPDEVQARALLKNALEGTISGRERFDIDRAIDGAGLPPLGPPLRQTKPPETLVEYLSRVGIRPDDPELSDLAVGELLASWHTGKPFRRRILRADGLTVRQALERAEGEGFLGLQLGNRMQGADESALSREAYRADNIDALADALNDELLRGRARVRGRDEAARAQIEGDATAARQNDEFESRYGAGREGELRYQAQQLGMDRWDTADEVDLRDFIDERLAIEGEGITFGIDESLTAARNRVLDEAEAAIRERHADWPGDPDDLIRALRESTETEGSLTDALNDAARALDAGDQRAVTATRDFLGAFRRAVDAGALAGADRRGGGPLSPDAGGPQRQRAEALARAQADQTARLSDDPAFDAAQAAEVRRIMASTPDIAVPVRQEIDPETGLTRAETMSAEAILKDADDTARLADIVKGCAT
jgi:hypothetical protein